MSAAEYILERALNRVQVSDYPSSPLLVLSDMARADGEQHADWQSHADALLALKRQVPEPLTTWWQGQGRTKAEVVKLFADALFEVQVNG
jgi:hypothetical protein